VATNLTVNNLDLRIDADYEDQRDNATVEDDLNLSLHIELTDGQGSGKANAVFHDRRTLSATSETLDLYGGLTDSFGNTLNFDNIKGVVINNREVSTGYTLTVGGATDAFDDWLGAAGDQVKVGPGGWLGITNDTDGYGVTDGSTDELNVDAGANTITYDVIVIGEST